MKGANYSWMVCKGRKVVAMTTTQREAEAEAARVGGQVHPMPHKNPADPRFKHELGGGAFSKAYGADDPDTARRFYAPKGTDLDRLNYGVESVTKPHGKDVIDVAKTVLSLARMALNEAPGGPDKAALAFLPSIRPVRMDRTKQGGVEFIYKMPVYKIWSDGGDRLANKFAQAVYVNALAVQGQHVGAWVNRLERFRGMVHDPRDPLGVGRAGARWDGYIDALIRVTKTLEAIMNTLPLGWQGLDLHRQNVAVDKRGRLILLDPVVAEMKEANAVKLWQELGWVDHPKIVQRGGKAKGKKKGTK